MVKFRNAIERSMSMIDPLHTYCLLVEFLGQVLGPYYEIALYDLRNGKNTIIAIANNHISERTVGAPISDFMLNILMSRYFDHNDFKVNYTGFTTKKNKVLRASTFFIKDDNQMPIGMLCINFDDSAYIAISKQLLELCHPNLFISDHPPTAPASYTCDERLPLTLNELIEETLNKIQQDKSLPLGQLNSKEKLRIVKALEHEGVFSIKGSVKEVAKILHTSEPTIYRYLSQLNH